MVVAVVAVILVECKYCLFDHLPIISLIFQINILSNYCVTPFWQSVCTWNVLNLFNTPPKFSEKLTWMPFIFLENKLQICIPFSITNTMCKDWTNCLTYNIKQFVVTNCSKERSGSIGTKTLKNWILISIATSKESHFNADFKYISFIKFSLSHQKLRAWENLPYLGK